MITEDQMMRATALIADAINDGKEPAQAIREALAYLKAETGEGAHLDAAMPELMDYAVWYLLVERHLPPMTDTGEAATELSPAAKTALAQVRRELGLPDDDAGNGGNA